MKLKQAVAITTITGLCAAWSITSATQAAAATINFTYTGAVANWTAPKTGIVRITAVGAGGGGTGGSDISRGGNGAVVVTAEAVQAGELLQIRVGGGAGAPSVGGSATSVVRNSGVPIVVAGGGGGALGITNGGDGAASNSRPGGNGAGIRPGLGGNGNALSGRGGAGGGDGAGSAGGTEGTPNGVSGASSGDGGGGGFWQGGNGGASNLPDPGGSSAGFERIVGQYDGGGGAGFGGGGGGWGGAGGGGYGGGGGAGSQSGGGAGGSHAAESGTNSATASAQYYPGPVTFGGLTYGDGGLTGAGLTSGGDGFVQITTLSVAPFPVTNLAVSGKAKAKKRTATWTLPRTNIGSYIRARVKQKGSSATVTQKMLDPTKARTKFTRKSILKNRKNNSKQFTLIVTSHNTYGASSKVKKTFNVK